MNSSTKTVLGVIGGLLLIGSLVTGAIMFAFVSFVEQTGGDDKWKPDAIAERDLPALYGCRLPVKPLQYTSRAFGFQDGFYEVIVQLPPGSAEAFLGTNKLERGVTSPIAADVEAVIRELVPSTPALTATELTLHEVLLPDGGTWMLNRSGELLEGPGGEVWVHLRAFES